jgi:hypothetical protein
MTKFTKKPVEIEAIRIKEKTEIKTREGTLYGYPGEWLITGVEGEIYPCGDEIFRKSYLPSGEDKCSFCIYDDNFKRPCDNHEICVFEWKPDTPPLKDMTIGTAGANR